MNKKILCLSTLALLSLGIVGCSADPLNAQTQVTNLTSKEVLDYTAVNGISLLSKALANSSKLNKKIAPLDEGEKNAAIENLRFIESFISGGIKVSEETVSDRAEYAEMYTVTTTLLSGEEETYTFYYTSFDEVIKDDTTDEEATEGETPVEEETGDDTFADEEGIVTGSSRKRAHTHYLEEEIVENAEESDDIDEDMFVDSEDYEPGYHGHDDFDSFDGHGGHHGHDDFDDEDFPEDGDYESDCHGHDGYEGEEGRGGHHGNGESGHHGHDGFEGEEGHGGHGESGHYGDEDMPYEDEDNQPGHHGHGDCEDGDGVGEHHGHDGDRNPNEILYLIDGLVVYNDAEYKLEGVKSVETKYNEVEESLKYKITKDENNFIVVEQEVETEPEEGAEQKYSYSEFIDNELYSSTSLKLEKENNRVVYEISNKNDTTKSKYKYVFVSDESGDYIIVKVHQDKDEVKVGLIRIVTDENGNVDYVFEDTAEAAPLN